jgi:Ni/Fe-hydrogenase subunit HybB-like protein
MYLVLIILLLGARNYIPWVTHPVPDKAAWLNMPFMWARNLGIIAVLDILILLMVRWSLKTDEKHRLDQTITEKDHYRLTAISVAVIFAYVAAFTIISYDFIMSLSPRWYSTMFAPYYWVTNAYAALGVLVIMGALLRRPLKVVRYIEPSQFNDLGNLMLGFSLFSMGLFFAQYITIWYENMPQETFFLILRYYKGPWQWLGWSAFVLGYALPFILLQSRWLKHNPKALSVVSAIIIIGIALERYVLVVPSVVPARLGLSFLPGIGALAFIGLFILVTLLFLIRYAPTSAAQEDLRRFEPKLENLS